MEEHELQCFAWAIGDEPREQERHEDVPGVREEHESDRMAACTAPFCARGKVPA